VVFDCSEEGPGVGLGVVHGEVVRLASRRIPQIGWNAVRAGKDALFEDAPLEMAYYANSYVCRPVDSTVVAAWSEYDGDLFPAAVRAGNTVGVQFHPEKSSAPGVRFLHAFL